jgi:hypothetical protein
METAVSTTTPAAPTSVTPKSAIPFSTFVSSHLVWVVAIAVGLIVGKVALQEHDQRVAAEAQIKVSQAAVVSLQKQIASNDAAAAQKVQVIVREVAAVKTPAQAISAIPTLTDAPLAPRAAPDNPSSIEVAALPLVKLLGECKTAEVHLAACTSDLTNEKAISGQKDNQIADLKRKPKLLVRLKHGAELIGTGLAIGLILAAHL